MTVDQPWLHHNLDPQEPKTMVVETFIIHRIPIEIVIAKKTIIMIQIYTVFWHYLWCNIDWSPTGCMQQAVILNKKKKDQEQYVMACDFVFQTLKKVWLIILVRKV
jgi:hypothetical protein